MVEDTPTVWCRDENKVRIILVLNVDLVLMGDKKDLWWYIFTEEDSSVGERVNDNWDR